MFLRFMKRNGESITFEVNDYTVQFINNEFISINFCSRDLDYAITLDEKPYGICYVMNDTGRTVSTYSELAYVARDEWPER